MLLGIFPSGGCAKAEGMFCVVTGEPSKPPWMTNSIDDVSEKRSTSARWRSARSSGIDSGAGSFWGDCCCGCGGGCVGWNGIFYIKCSRRVILYTMYVLCTCWTSGCSIILGCCCCGSNSTFWWFSSDTTIVSGIISGSFIISTGDVCCCSLFGSWNLISGIFGDARKSALSCTLLTIGVSVRAEGEREKIEH